MFFSVCVYRGLFKTDKAVGTAQLKLEALENHCDVREIIEVKTRKHKRVHTPTQEIYMLYLCFIGDGRT